MPSRGDYWLKGGLVDKTVELADLTQSLQDQITGGGGGGLSTIADVTVSTPVTSIDVPFSTIDLVSGNVHKIHIDGNFNFDTDIGSALVFTINNLVAGNKYNTIGTAVNFGTVSGIFENAKNFFISEFNIFTTDHCHIVFDGRLNPPTLGAGQGSGVGLNGSYYYGSSQLESRGSIKYNDPTVVTLSSIQFKSPSGNLISAGSRFIVKTEGF